MKILVTGVYGFIGFSVARRLLDLGHEVIGIERITNSKSEKTERIKLLEGRAGFTVYDSDLSNFNKTKELLMALDFDLVLHLAGQYSVPYSEDAVLSFVDGNVRSWVHIMHIAHLKKIKRVVYASSTHVPESEDPANMYGATLKFREIASRTYNGMGIQTVAIRYSTTYGPYMRADSPQAQIMKLVYHQKEINLESGAFSGAYSWVHISDAVEITIRALLNEVKTDHVIVTAVANEESQSLRRCLQLVEEYSGKKAVTKGNYPEIPDGRKPEKQLAELKEQFGYVPQVDARTGIKEYVDWYLSEGKRCSQ